MSELQTAPHDEVRQGEQFAPFANDVNSYKKYFYIESYGCAMNFNDSEIVASILYDQGYGATKNMEIADLILVNTCSIRDKAEQTVRNRLQHFKGLKRTKQGMLVGILGCMAERLKEKLLEEEKLVDIVIGPDAYRSLPNLIAEAQTGQKGINVLLSREETYGDINPVRLDENGVTSYISIMRGCNNMCSFCVVPFTRGRERSRDPESIIQEAKNLVENGYKEVTLLGQNVDSYDWQNADGTTTTFAQLLIAVSKVDAKLRVRFSTSHPKDITDDVLYAIANHDNICNYIHLPVQSGNTRILQMMNRNYTREWYESKINRIKQIIPNCGLSTDLIIGFCSETEAEHQDTISLLRFAKYDHAFMYAYSERPGTLAARRYPDDVTEADKQRRLAEIVAEHRIHALDSHQKELGTTHIVLVEGPSKKNKEELGGRTDTNKFVVFPKGNAQKGDFVKVKITSITSGTLIGQLLDIL
jgi:tRNA-2-methylthio-N6-dimethylallyladenosine synthase